MPEKDKKVNLICKARIDKYRGITTRALKIAKKNIAKSREKEASEIVNMVSCYLSDSEYFENQGHLVNALSCLNYAHGWLDAGARLGIFSVKDRKLFTTP